jgi:hypothetical protein
MRRNSRRHASAASADTSSVGWTGSGPKLSTAATALPNQVTYSTSIAIIKSIFELFESAALLVTDSPRVESYDAGKRPSGGATKKLLRFPELSKLLFPKPVSAQSVQSIIGAIDTFLDID